MLSAKLVVVGGDAKTAEISLSLPTTIGRGREATLTLPHPLVSRQHCELFEKDGWLCVRDLESLNGTYVDNQRIESYSVLKPDQLLTIGNVTFRAIYSTSTLAADDKSEPSKSSIVDVSQSAPSDADSHVELPSDSSKEPTIHTRPTVRGNPAEYNPLPELDQTISAEELAKRRKSEASDVLVENESNPTAEEPAPQHSIVAALQEAGVTPSSRDDATLSDLRMHLPDENKEQASNIDGLSADGEVQPQKPASIPDLKVEEETSEKVDSGDSALGSFIRKLPR